MVEEVFGSVILWVEGGFLELGGSLIGDGLICRLSDVDTSLSMPKFIGFYNNQGFDKNIEHPPYFIDFACPLTLLPESV
jgi:hypothetical protein